MAAFTINIPDTDVAAVTQAICETYGYVPQIPDPAWTATIDNPKFDATKPEGPDNQKTILNPTPQAQVANPVPPEEFARQQAMRWVNEVYTGWHVRKATDQAQKDAQAVAGSLKMT